ncbi:glycoside hydrolase family protein [Verrucomicrobiaceae bacterium 5K15]|uniref:Glycoside hydrolase family protein n=1 Tax=Oceaniferula flava TaxID=2800421 RepID=A0AAE2VCY9_9BACT|nr:glycoside hydrolase family protein [Oceaniferula flavus]MBK1855536.1 glycoside hydrolase family protein [Oceaniferula flavus]MBM1136842.1 glycoside hydrolase family protein [Oceaniferula flavus]
MLKLPSLILLASCFCQIAVAKEAPATKPETFSKSWNYRGIILNEPGWDLWGASPVMDDDGKVHLFVARWPGKIPFNKGWRFDCEIARYMADSPEGPFTYQETILKPQPDTKRWDRLGLHNPNIQRLSDGRYVLSYIGRPARKGQPGNQRIGMVIADSLKGPWKPVNGSFKKPLLDIPSDDSVWCYKPSNGVCNPALLEMPNGKFHLYFKSSDGKRSVMGVAIADQVEGPYVFHPDPITKNNATIEDGYAFHWNGEVCFVTTDNHGMIEKGGGLLWRSKDGITFNPKPQQAFPRFETAYLKGTDRKKFKVHYSNRVKFERPQILLVNGQPRYMYVPCGVATDGSDGTNVHLLEISPEGEK